MKRFLLASALCLVLAGCMSTAERALAVRRQRYDAMLSQIKPGATRADLRRVLPASARMRPFTASIIAIPFGNPGNWEIYPLDADLSVIVSYQYQRTRWRHPPPISPGPPALPSSPTASDIDNLLFGHGNALRVYPQPTDIVSSAFPLRAIPSAGFASCSWLIRPR